MLNKIFKKYGVPLVNSAGELRNVVDVIEDMFLKLSTEEIKNIMNEIAAGELEEDLFDALRGRKYEN